MRIGAHNTRTLSGALIGLGIFFFLSAWFLGIKFFAISILFFWTGFRVNGLKKLSINDLIVIVILLSLVAIFSYLDHWLWMQTRRIVENFI